MGRGAQDAAGALRSCVEGSGRKYPSASAQERASMRNRSWTMWKTVPAAIRSRGEAVCPEWAAGGEQLSASGAGVGRWGGLSNLCSPHRSHPGPPLSQ